MDDPDTAPRSGSGPKPSSGDKRARGRAGGRNAPIDMGMLPDLIGYNLRFAQVSVFQHFTAKLGSFGISAPQFGTLLLIDANPGVSQSSVAEALRFDRSTLVQIIDRLENRGLVVRAVSAHDRRSHALELTESGAELLATLKNLALEHEDEMALGLEDGERETLIRLLERIHSPNER
jgi:DNA-binding MarR family transcriptional regulator